MTKKENVLKFMQYIEKLAKVYEFNIPYGSYDIYAFAKDLLVWLEKQGEQKPQGKSALEAIKEEKVDNANKVEPEFKVGDWITFYGSNPYKILKIEADINGVLEYLLLDQNGHDFYFSKAHVDKNVRLWTIQDAKDGDVLSFYSEYKSNKMVQIGIIEKYVGKYGGCSNTFKIYVGVNWDNNLQMGKYMGCSINIGCSDIHPATKEQRDLLFQKMKESGYEWDADKKELKKLVLNKFDPKTLKPFDKVLVKQCDIWHPDFYSCYIEDDDSHVCSGLKDCYFCIPYNDDTKHLAGTKDEAPDYYRYWED